MEQEIPHRKSVGRDYYGCVLRRVVGCELADHVHDLSIQERERSVHQQHQWRQAAQSGNTNSGGTEIGL